jgi:hypothetical protein
MAAQFSDMYEMVDGINLHDLALKLALDETISVSKRPQRYKCATSFVYRRFDGKGQDHFPDSVQLKSLQQFDPDSQLHLFKKSGNELKRETKWLQSYRYACLNMGAETEDQLMEKYRQASKLIGFPAN